jgi:hypothetical protein
VAVFALLLAGQVGLALWRGVPEAGAQPLGRPPSIIASRLASLDDPVPLAKMLDLYLQAHDVQPGLSLPWRELDYGQVVAWLGYILQLDPQGQYPLFAAARLYTQVPDLARQRIMTDFVAARYPQDPLRRWPWMAHVAYVAKIQMKDPALTLRYAAELRQHAEGLPQVPAWARQMEIFLRMGENDLDTAKALLGALLASGQIHDDNELRFLTLTLKELEQK